MQEAACQAMIDVYRSVWDKVDCEVLAVEREFSLPYLGWEVCGRIDRVVRGTLGVYVVELKTSSEDVSIGSNYQRRLQLSGQAAMYAMAYPCDGVLFDVIRKPHIQPLKAAAQPKIRKDGQPYAGQRLIDETVDEYRARYRDAVKLELIELQPDVEGFRLQLKHDLTLISLVELNDLYARNDWACQSKGSLCEYFGHCAGEEDLFDDSKFVDVDTHSKRISHSRRECFNSCRQKHYYHYTVGRIPIFKSDALKIGTRVHELVEEYWNARSPRSLTDNRGHRSSPWGADPT